MKKFSSVWVLKISVVLILALSIIAYFYFESSLTLRIVVVFLGLLATWQINNFTEFIILFTLFLSLYALYNIHYGLNVPIALIMILVLLISSLLFYVSAVLGKFKELIEKDVFRVYSTVMGLAILELFLTMGFWPVDPRTKSIVILVFFYLSSRIIFLFVNNVLSLKRALGFIVASLLVLVVIIALSMRFSF